MVVMNEFSDKQNELIKDSDFEKCGEISGEMFSADGNHAYIKGVGYFMLDNYLSSYGDRH